MKVRFPNAEELFWEVDQTVPEMEVESPPCIGISSNRKDGLSCIAETYVESVVLAGGSPLLIPVITDIKALTTLVSKLDGLIMTGGGDVNPLFLNEEPIPELQDVDPYRDAYDLLLLRLALNLQIPVFGICRGHQLLNAVQGGSLYQDIYSQSGKKLIKHSQTISREYASHTVEILPGKSKLSSIFRNEKTVQVNSFHHQGVNQVAPEFIETAIAPDDINEAMEHPEKYIFSVQWHPEAMTAHGNKQMLELFRYHVSNASLYRKAKKIHEKGLIIDSHTDTATELPYPYNLGKKEGTKVNLPLMEAGKTDAAFMVAYVKQAERDEQSLQAKKEYVIRILEQVKEQAVLNATRMAIAYSPDDLKQIKEAGKKAIFLGIENGYAIGKDINNLTLFKELGVSYITLCHNGDNDICDSAVKSKNEWNGLSPFGKEVVREMNRLGIMIDISHTAEKTVFDVLEESHTPIIASHSSARALCDHPRNLTDEQIKAIARKGGVIQICLYEDFINKEEKASVSDAIRHINHIVKLVGVDHVGIGSDFDGGGELIGCRDTSELINLTMKLLEEGYSEEDILKIWGGNLLRVMNQVLKFAEK